MHFDSRSVNVGGTAVLESRILYPKRGFQCLEFYLYNSGSENDQLNIYVREYAVNDTNGKLTLVEEIKGKRSTSLLFGFKDNLLMQQLRTGQRLSMVFRIELDALSI